MPERHLLGVKPGTSHRVAGGQGPIESFSIRVPGCRDDKVVEERSQVPQPGEWFLMDLRGPVPDYQAGACLPPDSPSFSRLWDFWSGWPKELSTWQGQERHWHSQAEEYYVVLQGRLDLEIDGSLVHVGPGHLLGVKPGAIHVVVGGQAPVDTFFLRVPGGRGDKNPVDAKEPGIAGVPGATRPAPGDERIVHDE